MPPRCSTGFVLLCCFLFNKPGHAYDVLNKHGAVNVLLLGVRLSEKRRRGSEFIGASVAQNTRGEMSSALQTSWRWTGRSFGHLVISGDVVWWKRWEENSQHAPPSWWALFVERNTTRRPSSEAITPRWQEKEWEKQGRENRLNKLDVSFTACAVSRSETFLYERLLHCPTDAASFSVSQW